MKKNVLKIVSVLLCLVMTAALIGINASQGTAGDVNRDGSVDNKDVVALFRYLNGDKTEVDEKACDTNGDGEQDNKDVVTLFRHVSDPGIEIFYGDDDETEEITETETETEPADITDEDLKTDIVLADYNFLSGDVEVVRTFNGPDGSYGLYNTAKYSGSTVTIPSGDHGGVYPTFSAPSDKTVTYTFYLESDTAKSTAAWCTFYLGLRLNSEHADPTNNEGVWIAMRNTQIGLRTRTWPNTTYVNASSDFSAGVKVTVTDDPVNNVIRIYAGEDKKEIASVEIDGKNYVMTNDKDEKVSVESTADVISGGYAHLWAHYPDSDVTLKDISITTVRQGNVTDNNGIKNNSRDLFADTWVAYDDNGREIASSVTKPNGTKVGMFYFLWHEETNNKKPLFDHTASYLSGGLDGLWYTMQRGARGFAHYWAEPYFGYYSSNDEWVIRKHGAMLYEAGVDFIFFDATNGLLYPTNYEAVLRVWAKMRAEGLKTPDVCFLMREKDTDELSNIWANLYSVNQYEDLWFRWNGKPVMMFTGANNTLTEEQSEFFTIRYSWANENDKWYTSQRYGVDCWAWGTMYPQRGGYTMVNGKRTLEQMVVMCGFWANGSYGTNGGRSYTYKTGEPKTSANWDMGFALFPETSGKGLAYQEQFDRAIKSNPKLIMITGWNEWWAGRWTGDLAVGQTIAYEYTVVNDSSQKEFNYYVDNLNPEYSRDLEPMKGGFKDNYFYQTVMNVRAYKGSRPVEAAFGQKTIDINGSLAQWVTVGPEYRDVYGDTAHRNHLSHVGNLTYTNDTGRNDIITAKVSEDDNYLYFYAECTDNITKPEGENWMNLFIKADADNENGWYGFDFVVNRQRENGKASIQRFTNGWNFSDAGEAEYTLTGNVIVIKLEKALIGYNGTSFDFKWADNSVNDGDIMGFLDQGDAAPDGRFCYRYTTEKTDAVIPECLTPDMAVFKANGYNAYINGKSVRLSGNNTKAVLLATGYEYYLPVNIMETLGIDCTGEEVYDHYGVQYVRADTLAENSGKSVTVTPDGLLVIANEKITDESVLDTLYRSLY